MPQKTEVDHYNVMAKEAGVNVVSLEFAQYLDKRDELHHLRDAFYIPKDSKFELCFFTQHCISAVTLLDCSQSKPNLSSKKNSMSGPACNSAYSLL
jgi:hypothetical protein